MKVTSWIAKDEIEHFFPVLLTPPSRRLCSTGIMAANSGVKKGNYVRRKQRSPSPVRPSIDSTSSSSRPRSTPAVNGSSKSHGTPADPNRVQFEQQEDFIGFDFSDGEENNNSSSRDKRRESRGGGKRKHDDRGGDDSDKQEEGTRQLRKREKERSTPWCDEPGVSWSSYDNATAQ